MIIHGLHGPRDHQAMAQPKVRTNSDPAPEHVPEYGEHSPQMWAALDIARARILVWQAEQEVGR